MRTAFPSLLFLLLLTACNGRSTIYTSEAFEWQSDRIVQGDYVARALSDHQIVSSYQDEPDGPEVGTWTLSRDISDFPHYTSRAYPLETALYNLSIEEMMNAVEADSTFRTGKEWAGVWTRDISYSIILAMAHLQPEVSKISLMKKVSPQSRIIQDTGTGGAWPCSSDRMIWAVAAWEIYLVTGDSAWLNMVYPIILASVEDDLMTVTDPEHGFVLGESSFLDWREQEYPRWMDPKDIYKSINLGTSAVHCRAYEVLGKMAQIKGDAASAEKYSTVSKRIKEAINRYLWLETKGYYAQYLYGRNSYLRSERSETLGEALCIIWGIADESKRVRMALSLPTMPFGTPCFYPEIQGIPPYHNEAVWPFVQSFWGWACADAGHETGVVHAMASVYRAAALFLTNQENFVVETGHRKGTEVNSANMLWSLSGNLSLVYHVLFGMRYTEEGLAFVPFVPKALNGERRLSGVQYRDAILDCTLKGYGVRIARFMLDDQELETPIIPTELKGRHHLTIVMDGKPIPTASINMVENSADLETPVVTLFPDSIAWEMVTGAVEYQVFVDGTHIVTTESCAMPLAPELNGEIQVCAVDWNGVSSFASEPIRRYHTVYTLETEDFNIPSSNPYTGFSGNGFVATSRLHNRHTKGGTIQLPKGLYAIDWRYANGNGPINTENKCAIRSLMVDGKEIGVHVFPHRGTGVWNDWGWSNSVFVELSAGRHRFDLEFHSHNENMNIKVNEAMIDCLRITKLE